MTDTDACPACGTEKSKALVYCWSCHQKGEVAPGTNRIDKAVDDAWERNRWT